MSIGQLNLIKLDKSNFDNTIAKNNLLVIEFWAQWCAPCQSFKKIYEEAANAFPDVLFGSVNVDAEPELAEGFNVRSVPFLVILKKGVAVYAESGALRSVAALKELIKQAQHIDESTVEKKIAEAKGEEKD